MKTKILILMLFTFSVGFSTYGKVNDDLNKSVTIYLNKNFITFIQPNLFPRVELVTITVDCDGDGYVDMEETVAEEYEDAMTQQMIDACNDPGAVVIMD